jgi:MtN3 and saliva related transmembrane protein
MTMEGWLPTILGTVAGILSTSSFVPQVLKAWREGNTEAISMKMYVVTVSAFTLWTVYGFVIGSMPIIIFNILSLMLSGTILVLKLRGARSGAAMAHTEPGVSRSG